MIFLKVYIIIGLIYSILYYRRVRQNPQWEPCWPLLDIVFWPVGVAVAITDFCEWFRGWFSDDENDY